MYLPGYASQVYIQGVPYPGMPLGYVQGVPYPGMPLGCVCTGGYTRVCLSGVYIQQVYHPGMPLGCV